MAQEFQKFTYTQINDPVRLEQENLILKETVAQLKNELDKFRETPLMLAEIHDIFDKKALIKIPNGNEFYVNVSNTEEKFMPGDQILVEQKNLTVIKKLNISRTFNVERYIIVEKPTITWDLVGGLHKQKNEIQEVVELPLLKPELFKQVGIVPPKGVLLYGEPGTGKTLLAKAVAKSTNSTFIEIVGSEMVQKFIGEGAKLVKDMFDLARQKAPTIIFIDEIDAIAAKRIELGTSGEREVQRTFMQLLAELDGFKPLDNVKIIGATNRKDILDEAILRPGRLDRIIHIDLPNEDEILEILKIHTKNMKLKNVKLEDIYKKLVGFSGAEIKAISTEAGYFAIRDNRKYIIHSDFISAIDKVREKETEKGKNEYLKMFG